MELEVKAGPSRLKGLPWCPPPPSEGRTFWIAIHSMSSLVHLAARYTFGRQPHHYGAADTCYVAAVSKSQCIKVTCAQKSVDVSPCKELPQVDHMEV